MDYRLTGGNEKDAENVIRNSYKYKHYEAMSKEEVILFNVINLFVRTEQDIQKLKEFLLEFGGFVSKS